LGSQAGHLFLSEGAMSTAIVDICNQALAHIGIDDSITDLEERSKAARLCRTFFNQTRDAVLRDCPWGFAVRTVQAALAAGDPPPGWAFQYQYPTDCLQVLAMIPPGGDRNASLYTRLYVDGVYPDFTNIYQTPTLRVAWETRYSPGGRVIVCDVDEAWIRYTIRVTDPNAWDSLFIEAMSYAIAGKLAMPMAAQQTLAAGVSTSYAQTIAKAKAANLNEQGREQHPDSVSITGRL
jgi:hypothetical protein